MCLRSASALSLPIRFSGCVASKFRSKIISAGFDRALCRRSFSVVAYSSFTPACLAASLILAEKNRSLTTASTVWFGRFCIGASRSYPLFLGTATLLVLLATATRTRVIPADLGVGPLELNGWRGLRQSRDTRIRLDMVKAGPPVHFLYGVLHQVEIRIACQPR